jgi:hypothetical protein
VPAIERQLGYAINVFSFYDDNGKARHPVYISRYWAELEDRGEDVPPLADQKTVDLLYFSEHWAYIHDFSRFMGDFNNHNGERYWCKRCLSSFRLESKYKEHASICRRADFIDTIVKMPIPDKNDKLKFSNFRAQARTPFVIYADCESALKIVPEGEGRVGRGSTNKNQHHQVCAIGFKVVSTSPTIDWPYEHIIRHNENEPPVMEQFLKRLLEVETEILQELFDIRKLIMTDDDQAKFDGATECYICKRPWVDNPDENTRKVRDHCHITGQFRGAAHANCNLQMQADYKIPVFFHNYRNYDGHFVTMGIDRVEAENHGLQIIGQGLEKYLQFSWGKHIVFRDSYQILSASLEALVANLQKDSADKFRQLRRGFEGRHIDTLLKKGVFPYDWFSSLEKLTHQRLPAREDFFSILKQQGKLYIYSITIMTIYLVDSCIISI